MIFKRNIPMGYIILLLAIIFYGVLCAYAWLASDSMLFYPHRAELPAGVNAIPLRCSDGTTISAVYLRNDTARVTVLYSYGNGEDVAANLPFLRELYRAGFSVFAYDYPRYGMGGGRTSENGIYRAIDAAYNYLTTEQKIPSNRIIVIGRSLGGAAACDLAARRPVAGLVMISSFATAFRVMTRYPILPFDKFSSIRKIKRVNCPVLLIHGTRDRTVAFWHSQALFDAARQPKQLVPVEGAGHNDLFSVAGEGLLRLLTGFAASLPTP